MGRFLFVLVLLAIAASERILGRLRTWPLPRSCNAKMPGPGRHRQVDN